MLKLRQSFEDFSEFTGTVIAWLTLTMVLVTFIVVVLRYAFDLGWISMQESVTWMHAAVFMLGAAYTLKRDEHVRVDIFYRGMSVRRKAIVDLLGTLIFLLPMAVFLAMASWDYVYTSWVIREAWREAGGLPYPFVPILKSLIPATAGMLILQGIANLIRAILTLTGGGSSGPDRKLSIGEAI
jgi:TRAP-type mannitol/chloroaromatic compound transport system permease small subunit